MHKISLWIFGNDSKKCHHTKDEVLEHRVIVHDDGHVTNVGKICPHFAHNFFAAEPMLAFGI